MAHFYPSDAFLEDFSALSRKATPDAIAEHMRSKCQTQEDSDWRFKVFCRTCVLLLGFSREFGFQSFVQSHHKFTHEEVLTAVTRALHLLVCKNIDRDLSFRPSWDEVCLTANFYFPQGARSCVPAPSVRV